MTHQHGGRPGSGTHGGGKGASGGGSGDIGSRNWEIDHGINVGGGGSDSGEFAKETPELKIEKQPKEKSTKKLLSDLWKLFVNDSEWDLSDVITIDIPCRDYCCWILTDKNGKKTRITGNVILEEI